jgi:hypothetical protein
LLLFVVGRYADVTSPALYGRPVNLYWDAKHLPAVAAMLAEVASPWFVVFGLACVVALLAGLWVVLSWCVARVVDGLNARVPRRALGGLAASAVALYTASSAYDWPARHWFSLPVSATYARQAAFLMQAFAQRTDRELPIEPLARSDLQRIAGLDVLVMFLESYGAVSYDAPAIAKVVSPARAEVAAAAQETGRDVVSAFVESPTFGGASWLAHVTLMSGFEVRDVGAYNLLLTQRRETLPSRFDAAGYRVIAVMPGLRNPWPEGAFYGFDEIHDARDLDYRGPDFGWWRIPDQYTLAKLAATELKRTARAPVFAFFPTITTHVPFRPTPPLQPSWPRLLGPDPFDADAVAASLAVPPEWTRLAPAYAESFAYTFRYVAEFLRERKSDDFVLLLIGDHQPASSVSGQDARWDVPVHVIGARRAITATLLDAGFISGVDLGAHAASIARMSELNPLLLRAFDGGEDIPPSGYGTARIGSR